MCLELVAKYLIFKTFNNRVWPGLVWSGWVSGQKFRPASISNRVSNGDHKVARDTAGTIENAGLDSGIKLQTVHVD